MTISQQESDSHTHRFYCTGFRSVTATSMRDAASIFATRAARRSYGRRGYASLLAARAWSEDGRLSEFSAFVGYATGPHETTGHRVYFTVHADGA